VSKHDIFDNLLIHGDNLLALKALEQEFAGKIKCVYIDPPFNTGSAFAHYDDNLEHSMWLNMMKDRLELLHRLLTKEGAIVVNLDDTEMAYCKVMMIHRQSGNFRVSTTIFLRKWDMREIRPMLNGLK
jgi:adenine-specific DNA-methyltransferase